jgi:hypothetical protein
MGQIILLVFLGTLILAAFIYCCILLSVFYCSFKEALENCQNLFEREDERTRNLHSSINLMNGMLVRIEKKIDERGRI